MTEREYEGLRRGRFGYDSGNGYHREEPRDGYFAFFKLRCLICLMLFFGVVAADQKLNLKDNDKTEKIMALLGKEEITLEECMGILE